MPYTPGSHRIAIGADHGGFPLKQALKRWLGEQGHAVDDCGTLDGSRCDYPDIAARVAQRVADGSAKRGILIDGAGIGSSMVANKFPRVRAALCYDVSSARNSREHNDANVLTLGSGLIGEALAMQIVDNWLSLECSEPRHLKRVAMIGAIERRLGGGGGGGGPANSANLALAGAAGSNDNAEPDWASAGSTRASRTPSVSFQARSASWLSSGTSAPAAAPQRSTNVSKSTSSAPRSTPPIAMDIDNLSTADLERVATRIAEMIGSSGGVTLPGGQCVCCGPDCAGSCVCLDPTAIREWVGLGVTRFGNALGGASVPRDMAGYIDHTLLKAAATKEEVDTLCAEAREHRFASVCVNPYWVKHCAQLLQGTQVKVCTVVGFPLGANAAEIKAHEARRAIRDGAREIDMVINIGALKGGDDATVFRDIRLVVDACEDGRALSKVIIETALLSDEEKVRACVSARKARADFVKTSTGFSTGGATAGDVALMAEVVRGTRMGVKASGGVRSLEDFSKMVSAGATRIGASAGIKIMKEAGN
jgi:deoxyribose-phosphate aldolase